MPEILVPLTEVEIDNNGFFSHNFVLPYNWFRMEVKVKATDPNADPDIYMHRDQQVSLTNFNWSDVQPGNEATLIIDNLDLGSYSLGIHMFAGSGKVTFGILTFSAGEVNTLDSITDVEDIITIDIDEDADTVNDSIDDITSIINIDLDSLSDSINGSIDDMSEIVVLSMSSIENSINDSLLVVSDTIETSNDELATSISNSAFLSASILATSLSNELQELDNSLNDIDNSIKDSIDELSNSIDATIPDILLTTLQEISNNIKAVSHNVIDDVLLSVFEEDK